MEAKLKFFTFIYFRVYSILIRIKIKLFILRETFTLNTGYQKWILKNEDKDDVGISFEYRPLISIILPIYNVKEVYLRECIESVLKQEYTRWELCVADDNSSEPHIKKVLEEYKAIDKRIKVIYRTENGHISACSNTALKLVTGDFTALLDNDDVLSPVALYEVVKRINQNKDLDLIYSDEDKLIDGRRGYPFFKTLYSKKLIFHINFICHLAVYRTSLLKEVNGFRIGFEGVQDWDLVMRIMLLTNRIAHIPKILYHWRISETSTAGGEHRKSYIKESRKKMLSNKKMIKG